MVKKVSSRKKADKSDLPVLLFLGTQASGKGTQARLVVKKYGFTLFEMGHFLRLESRKKTTLGKLIKSLIDHGYLVPSWVAGKMLRRAMPRLQNKPLIIDGAPRQYVEAKFHEKSLADFGRRVTLIVFFKLSEKEGLRRLLKRGRNDDTPESIKRRFAWSRIKLKTILNYFGKKYPIVVINGEQSISAVHKDVVRALKKRHVVKS